MVDSLAMAKQYEKAANGKMSERDVNVSAAFDFTAFGL